MTLFAAYRAYLSERERHKRLEFLYEANRTLARSREIAHALEGLLVRSMEAFRAELAEIILFGSEENPSLRTLLGPGNYRELMEPVDAEVADEMRHLLERGAGAITLDRPFGGGRLQRYLEARGVTHAMVAPLPGEERVIGAIMLANRFGVVRSFDHEDLRLLDTLAGNASVALQYDRLEQAVTQLSVLQEQLHHQAYHDPLTNLANRVTVHRQGQGDDRAAARESSPSCSSTSTTSRRSTTASATPPGTSCWCRSPRACARACDPRTWWRDSAATSSRCWSRTPTTREDGRGQGRATDHGGVRTAGRRRLGERRRVRERRHRRQQGRRFLRRGADPGRRRRDVQGQELGQGPLRGVPSQLRGGGARAPRPEGGAAPGDRAPGTDALLPANRRHRHRRAGRRGGAGPLGASAARAGRPVGVRAPGRGDRPDSFARSVRPRGGVSAGAPLAGRWPRAGWEGRILAPTSPST